MNIHTSEGQPLSVKELRYEFPSVIDRLEKGVQFILIHRSKPIGRLLPYSWSVYTQPKALALFARPPARMRIRSKRSAVSLTRSER